MSVAQEQWHEGMISNIFGTKANFRKERRARNTVYNGRSAFMKAKGLNAISVKPIWDRLSVEKKNYWTLVAQHLSEAAADRFSVSDCMLFS